MDKLILFACIVGIFPMLNIAYLHLSRNDIIPSPFTIYVCSVVAYIISDNVEYRFECIKGT